jgi:hypothetical protein
MPPDSRCRMLLKDGERCRYRAKVGSLCGLHHQTTRTRQRAVEKLIRAGKVAAASTALIKFIETIGPLLLKATPTISRWIANGSIFVHGRLMFSLPPAKDRSKRLLRVARYMDEAHDYSRLPEFANDVFEAVLESSSD